MDCLSFVPHQAGLPDCHLPGRNGYPLPLQPDTHHLRYD